MNQAEQTFLVGFSEKKMITDRWRYACERDRRDRFGHVAVVALVLERNRQRSAVVCPQAHRVVLARVKVELFVHRRRDESGLVVGDRREPRASVADADYVVIDSDQIATVANQMLDICSEREDFGSQLLRLKVIATVAPCLLGISNTPQGKLGELGRWLRVAVNANPIDLELGVAGGRCASRHLEREMGDRLANPERFVRQINGDG